MTANFSSSVGMTFVRYHWVKKENIAPWTHTVSKDSFAKTTNALMYQSHLENQESIASKLPIARPVSTAATTTAHFLCDPYLKTREASASCGLPEPENLLYKIS